MRTKIFHFLTSPISVGVSFAITVLLIIQYGNLGFFFALLVALLVLWGSKFRWLEFGLGKTDLKKTAVQAFGYAVLLFLLVDVVVQPLVELASEPIDLSALDAIRGNLINFSIFILIMWVFAAFGEEFIYRGFFMRRIALILGDTDKSWLGAAVLTSVAFGLAHFYQGLAGIITTGIIGFCLGWLFAKNRTNLMLTILVHGFYDMIGLTLIYYSQERIISDWVIGLFQGG